MIIVANSIYDELRQILTKISTVIELSDSRFLYDGIRNHPDLQIVQIKDRIYVTPEVYHTIKPYLRNSESFLLVENPGTEYPQTANYNCIATPTFILCNTKILGKELLAFARKENMEILHTNQGYTRCTTVSLNSNTFITDDVGIFNTLSLHKIDCLLIQKGHVLLDHHDYGFIGGCCGMIGNTLYINGSLDQHPDNLLIRSFCKKQSIRIIDIPNKTLRDIGGIICIN